MTAPARKPHVLKFVRGRERAPMASAGPWMPEPLAFERNGLRRWSLDEAIQRHVTDCVNYAEGDYKWAADELRIDVSTLFRWRRRWEREAALREALEASPAREIERDA